MRCCDAYHIAVGKGVPVRNSAINVIVPAIRFEQIIQRGPVNRLDELTQVTFGVNLWFIEYGARFQINYLKDFKNDGLRDQWRLQYQVSFS